MILPTLKPSGLFRHCYAFFLVSLFLLLLTTYNLQPAYAVPNDATYYLQNWNLQGGGNAADAGTSLSSTDYKIIKSTIGEIVGGSPKSADTAAVCDATGGAAVCKIQPGLLNTRLKFSATGTATSINLLSGTGGNTIDSFIYNLPSLPAGTTATVQFSQDKTAWVNSSNVANGTNTLTYGVNTISLSTLGWATANFYYKIAYTGPGNKTPALDSIIVNYGATAAKLRPVFVASSTDGQNDYLRYKIDLCTDLAMTANCQTFDQTASQTGWSEQNTQSGTAYTSGTQAYYSQQSDLTQATTYYWRSYAKDPAGTNVWSAASTINSFTTGIAGAPTNCDVAELITPNQVRLTWTDNATIEDNHLLERSAGSGFSQIASLNPDTATYTDTLSTAGTYRYRVRVKAGSSYSDYCTVPFSVIYPFTNIKFEGIIFR